jgi:soluble lytic murein transglycosylase-like protein/tetratricopeptide (TPR) repeat protein
MAAMFVFVLLLSMLPVSLEQDLDRIAAARREARPAEALALIEQLRDREPVLYKLNNVAYLEAVLLKENGKNSQAEARFLELQKSGFPVRDTLLLHLIDATRGAPLEKLRAHYISFLENHTGHSRWGTVAFDYAQALERAGSTEQALQWYGRLYQRKGAQARSAGLRRALLIAKTSPEAARQIFRELVEQNQRDDVALRSALELEKVERLQNLTEAESRRRAVVFLNNRDGERARKYLQSLRQRFPVSPSQAEYAHLTGRSYAIEGDYKASIQAYEEAYRSFPSSAQGIFSKYLTGNMYLLLKDYESAVPAYRHIIDRHPQNEYFSNAFYNLADTYHSLNQGEKAEETALLALSRVPPKERDRFHYYLARLFIEQRRFAPALERLRRLEHLSSQDLPAGVTREEIHYWKGTCLEILGSPAEAQEAYRVAALGSPNYFAYLSRFRLPAEIQFQLAPNPANADPSWRLASGRRLFTTEQEAEAHSRNPSAAARFQELLFLRLYDEAYYELSRTPAAANFRDQQERLYNLAALADLGHLPAESIAAAEQLQRLAFTRTAPERYPEALRNLLYPRHYWPAVKAQASRQGVDPFLILAIIHQESKFQPDAKSPAAARGLMQIMPATGKRLATQLGLPPPDPADLYDPGLSIELGTYYVRSLLRNFGDSAERAVAAYNGGSDNVRRWSDLASRENPAVFVSNIGFRETKLYVLRVMGNYYAYRSLYGETSASSAALSNPQSEVRGSQ